MSFGTSPPGHLLRQRLEPHGGPAGHGQGSQAGPDQAGHSLPPHLPGNHRGEDPAEGQGEERGSTSSSLKLPEGSDETGTNASLCFLRNKIQRVVISGGNFKPDTLKPKEVVSLLLDDDELEKKRKLLVFFVPPSHDASALHPSLSDCEPIGTQFFFFFLPFFSWQCARGRRRKGSRRSAAR